MRINEIFGSLQGEGRYAGSPCLFIRMSGCTRKCLFCDTSYHTKVNMKLTPKELAKKIIESNQQIIVFTGGEPLLQLKEIIETINILDKCKYFCTHHFESNGDLLNKKIYSTLCNYFKYLVFSPKELKSALKVNKFMKWTVKNRTLKIYSIECKIVTDLKWMAKEMLKYATMLMPLTTYNKKKDLIIRQNVWNYCFTNKIRYTERLQNIVWGKKKGV